MNGFNAFNPLLPQQQFQAFPQAGAGTAGAGTAGAGNNVVVNNNLFGNAGAGTAGAGSAGAGNNTASYQPVPYQPAASFDMGGQQSQQLIQSMMGLMSMMLQMITQVLGGLLSGGQQPAAQPPAAADQTGYQPQPEPPANDQGGYQPQPEPQPPANDQTPYPQPEPQPEPPANDQGGYQPQPEPYPQPEPPANDQAPYPQHDCPPQPPAYDVPDYVGDGGRHYGDPHFVGDDGGKYDVMGEDGGIYNMLSDQNIQYNARFGAWGDKGATVIDQVGLQVGNDQVQFGLNGAPTVNGVALEEGQTVDLDGGTGSASYVDGVLTVNSGEYTLEFERKTSSKSPDTPDHINGDYTVNGNPFEDGVAAHGLWGQTVDADTEARNGDKGAGAQGGGAIDTIGADGQVALSEAGDKDAVNHYQVSSLFAGDFDFNRFGAPAGTGLA